uniref:DUF916 and DUF3324 domain-containing protein n=1 Tax=Enterococcus faecalis TaxID=1351 RepID=UPI00359C69AA
MRKYLIGVFMVIVSILFSAETMLAEARTPAVGFQAEAQLPENQINKEVSYFHIGVKAKEEVTLHVRLDNSTEKEVTLFPTICAAKTNSLGVVEYTTKQGRIGEKGQETIEAIATIKEKEIKLAPKETYDLKIQVKMPEKEFQGLRAGAIRLLQKETEKQTGNVRNQFAREIGIILESSSPEEIATSLAIKKAEAGQLNARNVVDISVDNPQAKFCTLTELKGEIKEKKTGKVIAKSTLNQAKLAPTAIFKFPVRLAGKEFEAGNYIATLSAKEGNKTWHLEKEFTITKKESKTFNQSDVEIKHTPSFLDRYWLSLLILLSLFLVCVLLSFYVIWKRSKH